MKVNWSKIPIVSGMVGVYLLMLTLTGCGSLARSHFDITRELGISPPKIEEEGDFHTAAQARCQEYDKGTPVLPDCLRYHETLLWASDYKSFTGARAALNKNVIWAAGALGLASVGALTGLAAFGSTGSDAYKVLPIAGAFVAGLLGFSQNDALFEAYQQAETKIDQAIRRAKNRAISASKAAYEEATKQLRDDVGSAVDELAQKKLAIVKFQGKNSADQFKEIQKAKDEGGLSGIGLKSVEKQAKDAQQITVTMNQTLDSQKVTPEELRIKLVDLQSRESQSLWVSTIQADKLTAEIPKSLQSHLPARDYLVVAQARHGEYTFKDAHSLKLDWSKARLVVKVIGVGKVTVPGCGYMADSQRECEVEVPAPNTLDITLTINSGTNSKWAFEPDIATNSCQPGNSCNIAINQFTQDTTVTVDFR